MSNLGKYVLQRHVFEGLDPLFREFQAQPFSGLQDKQKRERVNHSLLQLIIQAKEPCFLLSPVVDFIDRVKSLGILESYSFSHFELWLNQFSGLSPDENYTIRAKISGKKIPREEYQTQFPIGMGKVHAGSHFVTAHGSPDLDTTVASFWGWVDAFAARVSEGLHIWNVPGGAPSAQVEIDIVFYGPLGENVFQHLAKTRLSLIVSSLDLLSQKGVVKTLVDESTATVDHQRDQNAIILVDKQGYYLGDWRSFDVEGVRLVIQLLNHSLRWFAHHLQIQLVSLLAKDKVTVSAFEEFVRTHFAMRLQQSAPAKRFTEKQKMYVDAYLQKVLLVPQGLTSTFTEFAVAMKQHSLGGFSEFIVFVASLKTVLFDPSGTLQENRAALFLHFETIIQRLEEALQAIDDYVDRLKVALSIKTHVFGHPSQVVSYRTGVEELRSKMGNYPYLTVTQTDQKGQQEPLGVIYAAELHKPMLGTVSLRDFCNREETKIPPYLEVISVIDHHKGSLSSISPPVAVIADAQSSNSLVAALAFAINDKYSGGHKALDKIHTEIKMLEQDLSSPSRQRLMQRLLQQLIAAQKKGSFYIDPQRELLEYFHFLYAILDDTDFLTKVSQRDVECVASLLNRLKSLILGREIEVVHFDDLVRDATFPQRAAQKLLQNEELSSICSRIYAAKEEIVEKNLELCAEGLPSMIFSDTKEQNGCCRVGQTKLFAKTFSVFDHHSKRIRKAWYDNALAVYKEKNEVDLHLHMISTVSGCEKRASYAHKDEIWIWIPWTEQAIAHLKSFLSAFCSMPLIDKIDLEAHFCGNTAADYKQLFDESFISLPQTETEEGLPLIILRFKAGAINSRKALISPYLPKLVV